jgi:hypothetical protein
MFSAYAVFEAVTNHLKFVLDRAVLDFVFKFVLERGNLCWVEYWQELLAREKAISVHIEIRFAVNCVFFPGDFKKFGFIRKV